MGEGHMHQRTPALANITRFWARNSGWIVPLYQGIVFVAALAILAIWGLVYYLIWDYAPWAVVVMVALLVISIIAHLRRQ